MSDEQRREPGPPPRGLCAVGWDAGCPARELGEELRFQGTRLVRDVQGENARTRARYSTARTHSGPTIETAHRRDRPPARARESLLESVPSRPAGLPSAASIPGCAREAL